MGVTITDQRGLEWPDSGSPMHESFQQVAELIEKGLLQKIGAFGEAVSEFDPICVLEADDEGYIADGNDKTKVMFRGLAYDDYIENAEGHIYGPGSLVDVVGATWTRDSLIYVDDAKALSQTMGTYMIIAGWPVTDTIMCVASQQGWHQLTHIADPAACVAVTATSPGSGADATTPSGAEWAAAVTDLGNQKSAIDANNTAIDSILARLEKLGISADA